MNKVEAMRSAWEGHLRFIEQNTFPQNPYSVCDVCGKKIIGCVKKETIDYDIEFITCEACYNIYSEMDVEGKRNKVLAREINKVLGKKRSE